MRKIIFGSLTAVLAGLLAVTSVSCVSFKVVHLEKLNTDKPIEVDPKAANGVQFKQDGKAISIPDMAENLSRLPEADSVMTKRKVYFYASVVAAGTGGGLLGWALGNALDSGPQRLQIALGGVALAGVSYFLGSLSDGYLIDAVDIYNSRFSKSPKSANARVTPWVGLVDRGGVTGFRISY